MYIFKQAIIGGEVTSHQDSTFLYTTPKQTCIGLWLALDEATLENGCLWVRPGSHKERVRRQFVRNPEHFGKSLTGDGEDGDSSKPQMIFRKLHYEDDDITWEGGLPTDLHHSGFVPVPCKAGKSALVLFHLMNTCVQCEVFHDLTTHLACMYLHCLSLQVVCTNLS